MKAHKKALHIFAVVGIFSLTLAIVAEWEIDIQIAKIVASVFSEHRDFIINALLGLAGGCFVAVITEHIFLSVTIKNKIQNMLLQIRHIKSVGNKFYSDISKEEFLGVCTEIEQHFDLLQKDLDIYDIKFTHCKQFQEMLNSLYRYTGMILGGKNGVQYEKSEYSHEINDIRSVGEIRLAQCIAKWSPLVKRFSGDKAYQNYCDIDKSESVLYPEAPTIAALEEKGKNEQTEI